MENRSHALMAGIFIADTVTDLEIAQGVIAALSI